jgi:multicomponent K+:H+ antiporter subunit F
MLMFGITVATGCVSVALLLTLWRLARGPGVCDRILALDLLSMLVAALLIVLGIATRTGSAFDAALVVALLGFVGTVALARFAERGRVGGD